MTRLLPLLALAAAALAGCGASFLPQDYLNDARILAVVTDPTEVGPGETVTLTPTVYAPDSDPVDPARTAWTFCPLTQGAGNAFACAAPECETPLTPLPDGTVREDPSALALACYQKLAAGGTPPPGDGSGQVPELIETVFRLRIETTSGVVRESVTRVPLHTGGPPAARNLPPVVTGVELDGVRATAGSVGATIPSGGKVTVTVRVDPASIETYTDGNGRSVQETVVVSFYATAGRLDYASDTAPDAEDVLVAKELEAGQDQADVWVVARDLRGGVAVAGPFRVLFTP